MADEACFRIDSRMAGEEYVAELTHRLLTGKGLIDHLRV